MLFLDKKNIDALLHIGFIYHSLKENSKAFKCFKQVLKSDKNNFLGYYGLARLYQSLEKHNIEAINCFKKCLELEPDNIKANLQLGILFLKIKNYDESLIYLEKVVNLEPNNISVYFDTAFGKMFRKQKGKAIAVSGHIDSKRGMKIICDVMSFI